MPESLFPKASSAASCTQLQAIHSEKHTHTYTQTHHKLPVQICIPPTPSCLGSTTHSARSSTRPIHESPLTHKTTHRCDGPTAQLLGNVISFLGSSLLCLSLLCPLRPPCSNMHTCAHIHNQIMCHIAEALPITRNSFLYPLGPPCSEHSRTHACTSTQTHNTPTCATLPFILLSFPLVLSLLLLCSRGSFLLGSLPSDLLGQSVNQHLHTRTHIHVALFGTHKYT